MFQRLLISISIIVVCWGNFANAASPSSPNISTSRPSFTDTTTMVPEGTLQLENGATYTNATDGTRQWMLPETLIRLGITEHTEIRLSSPNYVDLKTVNHTARGFSDISVGLGQHLSLPKGISVGIYPILAIPTGTNALSGNAVEPEVRLVIGKNLTEKLQVSSMMASRWTMKRDAQQTALLNPTAFASYSHTDRITTFLEYAGIIPVGEKPMAGTTHYLQSGIIYSITPHQQLDARLGLGLNKQAASLLMGIGYSFKVDNLFLELD